MYLGHISSRLSAATIGVLLAVMGCATGENAGGATTGRGGNMGFGGGTAGTGALPASGGSGPGTGLGGSTGTGTGGGVGVGSGGTAATGSGGAPGTGGRTVAPPARLALPWTEDFEANAVGGAAANWIQHPKDMTGVWAIAMDGATKVLQQQNAAADLALMVGGDVGWTNFKVEAKVKIATASSDVLAIVAARYADPKNYYFLQLKGDGSMKIRKRIDDSTTDVLSFKSGTALVAGTWYTMAFGFQGSVLTAYLNGAMVATMTELPASILAGGIGLGAQSGAASFDDVKVTAL